MVRIAVARYPYLFIDEYQDTAKDTIEMVLDCYLGVSSPRSVVGLFGDSMQQIYTTGVGVVSDRRLRKITKYENRRCSRRVISVLNQMRPELQQFPSVDNVEGVAYLFSGAGSLEGERRLEYAREWLGRRGWVDENTKILFLTHRRIAGALQYRLLLETYDNWGSFRRDDLLDGDDAFVDLFKKIEDVLQAYRDRRFALVMQSIGRGENRVNRHQDKVRIADRLNGLEMIRRDGSVGTVVDYVFEHDIFPKSDRIRSLEEKKSIVNPDERDERDLEFLNAIRNVPYGEVVSFMKFRENETPFSTQHGVKGAEFESVIVAIDDTAWNLYNMNGMLAGSDTDRRMERSRRLLYVCCSRAKSGLAIVFLSELSSGTMATAVKWFGNENLI